MSQMPRSRPEIIAHFYRIIETHTPLAAIDCIIDIPTLNDAIQCISWPPELRDLKQRIKNPYFLATKEIMKELYIHLPASEIEINFDEQLGEQTILLNAWEYFKYCQTPSIQQKMKHPPIFKDSHTTLPIQAADLLAWHVRESAQKETIANKNIFEWECRKAIPRRTIQFTKNYLIRELNWLCSPESIQQEINYSTP